MDDPTTYALIMAGGAGTRFWPASRKARPKQLLPLATDAPLLRETALRLLPICPWERIFVSTGAHLLDASRAVLPELGEHQWLVEPVGRNTAPCIGWGAATIARTDPDAVVMALPADHHVSAPESFAACVMEAARAAGRGVITTVGIQPTRPETGYGYIEAGDPTPGSKGLQVKRFVEKPDQPTAEQYLAAGNYYWNSGMFFFRSRDMVAAIAEHMPDLARGLAELDRAAAQGDEASCLARVFPTLPATSIDYGVMEKVAELCVVPGDFGWSDIGSWLAAAELAATDEQGNHSPAGSVLIESQDNHVVDLRAAPAEGRRVIALVGVRGLVVVETDDALLVVERESAQGVKQVVDALKRRGDERLV
ncbi:MAG: NTP transferase domain-containing protein [Deltaproteobacteria bacterium]|jgi:mannose-1-phosphate guanylyltransferase|nr:NTP transferase domain-containing protein [Deltaproteobacteria bacterium]MBW2535680.1 NTP transferase domain-containing protein [Deltaproteobacteria bacterium]